MDLIIESFKRLYEDNQINESTLLLLLEKGIISEKDKDFIKLKEGE